VDTHQADTISRLVAHTIIWIKSGFGEYEVDFKKYLFTEEVILYLEPGQYFRLVSGDLKAESFPIDEHSIQISAYRYLFKHLISVGHITPHFLKENDKLANTSTFLQESLLSWKQLNPFHASPEELSILFDLYDQINKTLRNGPTIREILNPIHATPRSAYNTVRQKLNLSLKDLIQNRKLLEAQRELTFTTKPIKEIAYDLGFDDPAYFTRFFTIKKKIQPELFRESINAQREDTFITDLLQLIDRHYREHRSMQFYADKLTMSPRTLGRKVSEALNTTVKDISTKKLIAEASQLLTSQQSVTEIADYLGFKEPQHFTAFYKLQTGMVPSANRV
jgi:AraC-like DNA-binding protein